MDNTAQSVVTPSARIRFFKRAFDMVSSGALILVLLPFFILFTPIVAIAMRGNPFFVQKRPGKGEKIFYLIKYRTMTNRRNAEGELLSDSERMTKFGDIMRKLSIDELPELFNIFVGNMSVVGPRPLLVKYLPLYNDYQRQRHLVRPGLTGLAQISGRNAISWEQKFELDVEYINNISFWYDLQIIFATIKKVFVRDGISQEGVATMSAFEGNGENIISPTQDGNNEDIDKEFFVIPEEGDENPSMAEQAIVIEEKNIENEEKTDE